MKPVESDLDRPLGTRAKIIRLLLDRPCTVSELAKEASVTRNAVRAQIALLKREGLVQIEGAIKSTRRPSAQYSLRPGSDVHLSKAYPAVLSVLIRLLSESLPDKEFKELMTRLGQRLARSSPPASGSPEERIQHLVKLLKSMGSPARATRKDKDVIISSPSCLISAAVSGDRRVCGAMEAFVREVTGLPVRECCQHEQRPSCRFRIKSQDTSRPDPATEEQVNGAEDHEWEEEK